MSKKQIIRFAIIIILLLILYSMSGVVATCQGETKPAALSLRKALVMGIERNLDLKITELNVPIRQEGVTVNDAQFDPAIDASVGSSDESTPIASAVNPKDTSDFTATAGSVGLGKKSRFGLESRIALETNRLETNSPFDMLKPEYRNFLVLDLTQPLLRDFGTSVNTTELRISQNQAQQAVYGYMSSILDITRDIESTYYELARAVEVLRYRKESRELAKELLDGNRKKFEAGIVPVSEVQEAETALASRQESVIFARQQVEILSDRLKDLLEIRQGDLFYDDTFITEPIGGIDQPFPDFEQSLSIALTQRPDLQRQRVEIENRNIQVEFFDNQTLPRVDLVATLGVNGLSGNSKSQFSGRSPYEGNYGDSYSSLADADGYEWAVGLRFSYPLGNRAAKARVNIAEYEKRKQIYLLKRLEGRTETLVKNAQVTVKRSLERVTVSGRFERLAETTLNQENERLKKGLSDTFRMVNFQDALINARIRKITALADFNKGLSDLYRSMGTTLQRFDIMVQTETTENKSNAK